MIFILKTCYTIGLYLHDSISIKRYFELSIINEGTFGGCQDLTQTTLDNTLTLVSASGSTLRTSASTVGKIKPGSRIRVPSSDTPDQTYIVRTTDKTTVVTSDTFTVDLPFKWENQTSPITILVVDGGLPHFTVEDSIDD